jgi:ferrous iron transport protein B
MAAENEILQKAADLRARLGADYHDRLMESIYTDASRIADRSVAYEGKRAHLNFDQMLDRALTHPIWGFAVMGGMFFGVFWITITGANIPSAFLGDLLLNKLYGGLHTLAAALSAPGWLAGLLIDGVYLATAWVISVMLPPMAIFFPLFTLLEDFGYLPRVAFNLDRLFAKAGAHGKQSLSMMMGYGCNAAGIIATRIIDSPRERLIAIITNNFSICNGRWPTHPDRHYFRRGNCAASVHQPDRGSQRRRDCPAGDRLHVAGFLGAFQNVAARRDLCLQP